MPKTVTLRTVEPNKWCRHRVAFGDKNKVCEAGIEFRKFGELDTPKENRIGMPCLGQTISAIDRCPSFARFTPAERFDRTVTVRQAILDDIAAKNYPSGQMPCPCCRIGVVSYSKAGSRGHISATCSTKDCASWIE